MKHDPHRGRAAPTSCPVEPGGSGTAWPAFGRRAARPQPAPPRPFSGTQLATRRTAGSSHSKGGAVGPVGGRPTGGGPRPRADPAPRRANATSFLGGLLAPTGSRAAGPSLMAVQDLVQSRGVERQGRSARGTPWSPRGVFHLPRTATGAGPEQRSWARIRSGLGPGDTGPRRRSSTEGGALVHLLGPTRNGPISPGAAWASSRASTVSWT